MARTTFETINVDLNNPASIRALISSVRGLQQVSQVFRFITESGAPANIVVGPVGLTRLTMTRAGNGQRFDTTAGAMTRRTTANIELFMRHIALIVQNSERAITGDASGEPRPLAPLTYNTSEQGGEKFAALRTVNLAREGEPAHAVRRSLMSRAVSAVSTGGAIYLATSGIRVGLDGRFHIEWNHAMSPERPAKSVVPIDLNEVTGKRQIAEAAGGNSGRARRSEEGAEEADGEPRA